MTHKPSTAPEAQEPPRTSRFRPYGTRFFAAMHAAACGAHVLDDAPLPPEENQ